VTIIDDKDVEYCGEYDAVHCYWVEFRPGEIDWHNKENVEQQSYSDSSSNWYQYSAPKTPQTKYYITDPTPRRKYVIGRVC
jgi:hypothetical protein